MSIRFNAKCSIHGFLYISLQPSARMSPDKWKNHKILFPDTRGVITRITSKEYANEHCKRSLIFCLIRPILLQILKLRASVDVVLIVRQQDETLKLLVRHPHANVPANQTRKRRYESFVESCRSLFDHHFVGTLDGSAVLADRRVHETGLYHVDWWGNNGGAKPSCNRCGEVARNPVFHQLRAENVLFEDVVTDDFSNVHDGVSADVWKSTFFKLGKCLITFQEYV